MKINYLQEAYFKDVTVKREDTRNSTDKLAQTSRKVLQSDIEKFTKDWFLEKRSTALQGNHIFFINMYNHIELAPQSAPVDLQSFDNLIDHIDFDNKKIYINVYISQPYHKATFGDYLNVMITHEDKSPILLMNLFSNAIREQYSGFNVKYIPIVLDSIYENIPRPTSICFTFGNNLNTTEYNYILNFFRIFDELSIAVLRASMHDKNFYQFCKDFKYNERLNHNIKNIKIYWNDSFDEDTVGIPIGIISDARQATTFKNRLKQSVESLENQLGTENDPEEECNNRVRIWMYKKLAKIDFARMLIK